MDCNFEYGGRKYVVDIEAYEKRARGTPIVLPDNTVIDVGMWQEVSPPHPADLQPRQQLQLGLTPADTAALVDGVVAREV